MIGQTFYYCDRSKVSIYAICDPFTDEVRYIGQAITPQTRLESHIKDAIKGVKHKIEYGRYDWIRELIAKGRYPYMVIIDEVERASANEVENRWIAHYKAQGNNLLNHEDLKGTRAYYARRRKLKRSREVRRADSPQTASPNG